MKSAQLEDRLSVYRLSQPDILADGRVSFSLVSDKQDFETQSSKQKYKPLYKCIIILRSTTSVNTVTVLIFDLD